MIIARISEAPFEFIGAKEQDAQQYVRQCNHATHVVENQSDLHQSMQFI